MRAEGGRWRVEGGCVLALLLASGLRAAEVQPEEVVRAALEHSPALRMATAELDAAEAGMAQAAAAGRPTLDLDARYARYEGLEDAVFGATALFPAIENRSSVGVTLAQPLYTGGRIRHQRDGAAARRGFALASRSAVAADATLQALSAYWGWSKAYHVLAALDASVTRMETHARDMRNRQGAGMITENDLLATEVLLDRTCLRREEAQRGEVLGRAQLAFLTGRDLPAEAQPCRPSAVPAAPAGEADLRAAALSNRAERAALSAGQQAAEEAVRAAHAGRRPQVALAARYETLSPNPLDFPPAAAWKDDAWVGVTATWNVLDWGLVRAKEAEARARAVQAGERVRLQDEAILLEIRQARASLDSALARARVAERAAASAQRSVTTATDLWNNGLAAHADVLDAHAQLTDAQFECIAAAADAALAGAALDHAVGALGAPSEKR